MPTNQQTVTFTKGTVPSNACFSSVSELYNLFFDITRANVSGNVSLFNYGDAVPDVDNTDRPWIRTVGGLPDRLYVYSSGYWLAPHPVPALGDERRIWVGSLTDLKTYDGGSDEDGSDFTGPFWTVDEAMSARFPVGAGEFAGGTEVTVTETGGEDEVTLESAQVPDHTHKGKAYYIAQAGPGVSTDPSGNADNTVHENGGHTTGSGAYNSAGVLTDGMIGDSGQAHNNLPPYYGVYFIKRTQRIYYTVQ